ncbi:uncharacterized protein K452DRAFT_298115 [Aplosporella prunicola CBS 121167]|uniref:Uncharacterized protein n=1 Tax=Aplosporella prunicola CBS 121167 TaxID=1176127 RepID=A0A6A6BD59_9PEZI|nr:uncharacterized protein K452DRAFT_298115 [Aplosporella prunicola CBS 121167]KAF2142119.1 hypothetical protein K452DRAFT_298115 [Aplosporella prunicola CBS 121167]
MAAPWVDGPYHFSNGADSMFFGPMSPDELPPGVDDLQNGIPTFGSDCDLSPFGSERGCSKSPHSSVFSGYAPPAPPVQPLVTSFPAAQVHNDVPSAWDVPMDTDFTDLDALSNSPASSVQTPPLDTPFDPAQGYMSDGCPPSEQSWEMVPSRHGSVMSCDGFSQSSHGRPSIDSQFQAVNSTPLPQNIGDMTGRVWSNQWHEGELSDLVSPSEPSMQVSNSNSQFPTGSMMGFPQDAYQQQFGHATALVPHQHVGGMSPPWSSQHPRDHLNIHAGAGVHVFSPEYMYPSASDLCPMGQGPLMDPTYPEMPVTPDESAFSMFSGSPFEQYACPTQIAQGVTFPADAMGNFPAHGMDQPMAIETSMDFMPPVSPYGIPDYVINPTAISPRPAEIPRTANIELALSEASWNSMQVDACTPTHDSPPMIIPKSSESPPAFASDVQEAQSESSAQRNGGRQLGSHLDAHKRKNANAMREVGACWPCALQRDSCGHGDPCQRCEKRKNRPNGPHPQLPCDRTPLWELLEYFLPSCMTELHQPQALFQFVEQHTQGWSNNRIRIRIIPGRNLPPMACEAYEFHPRTNEPRRQFQYFKNTSTGAPMRTENMSPPLGMKHIEKEDQKYYSRYLDTIIEHHFEPFARMYCSDDEHDFQYRLLMLMRTFSPEAADEKRLLHDVLRLIVVTYIMGHTLILDEQSRQQALSSLSTSPHIPPSSYGTFCSPRVVNRQLKFLFCSLHQQIMDSVYRKLQQILKRGTSWPGKWTSAFVCMLGLAMCHEDTQKTVHLIMDYKTVADRLDPRMAQKRAETACEAIDMKFLFVMALFLRRSSKSPNPLNERDFEQWWRGNPDGPGKTWMLGFRDLVNEGQNFMYLQQQRHVKADQPGNFTARLVARFLTALSGNAVN